MTIGHIPGPYNPADSLMKLYRDPVEVINSVLYRYGPSQFETLEKLAEDTVATCKNGSFKFIGLPEKFLTEAPNVTNDSCNNCGEGINLCALARSQVKREKEEDLEAEEIENEIKGEPDGDEPAGSKRLKAWLEKAKMSLEVGQGNNLIDHHYSPIIELILEKETYLHWLSHYFHLNQIIRVCCFLVSCDIARNHSMATGIDTRKEGEHYS